MILIAYDGSADSRSAIEHAGELMGGHPAVVVTVWDTYINVVARYPGAAGALAGVDVQDTDNATRAHAETTAEEGAALARSHHLDATARAVAREDSIAQTLLAEAERSGAGAIVVGSRGLGGLGSLLLGSVSHALLQHADRPVVIVPSPGVACRRNDRLRAAEGTPA